VSDHVLWCLDPPGEGAKFGDTWPVIKCGVYQAHSQYLQFYLVGGSSNAFSLSQYCSNLFLI